MESIGSLRKIKENVSLVGYFSMGAAWKSRVRRLKVGRKKGWMGKRGIFACNAMYYRKEGRKHELVS